MARLIYVIAAVLLLCGTAAAQEATATPSPTPTPTPGQYRCATYTQTPTTHNQLRGGVLRGGGLR